MFGLNLDDILPKLLPRIVLLITALPFHEFAHGFVAHKLGDQTQKYKGRLTLNPLAHLDPVGTILILLTGFGWAKPVQVNPYSFKNKSSGMALTALAGPASNIILATFFLIILKVLFVFNFVWKISPDIMIGISAFFDILIWGNLGLAVFNLIPIPPLDGSRIAAHFIRHRIWDMIEQYQYIAILAVFMLLRVPAFSNALYFIIDSLYELINFLTSFVDLIGKAFYN